MVKDPSKRETGLFFFKGNENEKFALINAGGGFHYVAALHDSFPQALALSQRGYNAFALIYRPKKAYEDLAQALDYLYSHAG
ncbi:alpha/beta hydrolase, partial [Streptococcus ruminantium]|nr:alpha/beta hydrolase [Streptococcus ruminantium]